MNGCRRAAQLPEYMEGNGLNGGLAESSLVQLGRAYGNQRSDIQSQYDQGLQSLLQQQSAGTAAAAAQSTADTAVTDAAAAQTAAVSANANANTRMPIAGGTFTGNVHAATGYDNSWTVRNSFVYYANGSGTGQAVYGIGFYRK